MSVTDSTALMNRIYRHQRFIYDPTRKYFLLGRDRLIERLQPGGGDNILEIGCGTGRNLIEIARRYPRARLFGLDISTEMLTSAIAAIEGAGLSAQVRVTHADAGAFDPARLFGVRYFERIVLSYSLSMMPHWPGVLRHAAALLAPRGELHIVDFGNQEELPRWFRRLLRRWLALFSVTPRDQLGPVLTEIATPMGAGLTIERLYRGYAQYAILRQPADGSSADQ
jgi:S-adenosylmethionine-diacylgycerolhomoserine-N-methlytransferase